MNGGLVELVRVDCRLCFSFFFSCFSPHTTWPFIEIQHLDGFHRNLPRRSGGREQRDRNRKKEREEGEGERERERGREGEGRTPFFQNDVGLLSCFSSIVSVAVAVVMQRFCSCFSLYIVGSYAILD